MTKLLFQRSVYNNALFSFCQTALIHLYLEVSQSCRFTPKSLRNDILRRFIKDKIGRPNNKCIKKDLKRILVTAKKGDCEHCINKLINELLIPSKKMKSINEAIDLLLEIYEENEVNVQISENKDIAINESVHLLSEHLFNFIERDGTLIKPLSLLVYSKKIKEIIKTINRNNLFSPELIYESKDGVQGHILLHKKGLLDK